MVASNNKRYDRAFVLGLYLSTRSLQLSLDRASPEEWVELRRYLRRRVPIAEVLSHIAQVGCVKRSFDLTAPTSWALERKWDWKRKLVLSENELNVVAWWLAKAEALLAEDKPRLEQVGDVRLNLACCEEAVQARLSKRDQKLTNVEHFNQNPILECKPIEDLMGRAWPDN